MKMNVDQIAVGISQCDPVVLFTVGKTDKEFTWTWCLNQNSVCISETHTSYFYTVRSHLGLAQKKEAQHAAALRALLSLSLPCLSSHASRLSLSLERCCGDLI